MPADVDYLVISYSVVVFMKYPITFSIKHNMTLYINRAIYILYTVDGENLLGLDYFTFSYGSV